MFVLCAKTEKKPVLFFINILKYIFYVHKMSFCCINFQKINITLIASFLFDESYFIIL